MKQVRAYTLGLALLLGGALVVRYLGINTESIFYFKSDQDLITEASLASLERDSAFGTDSFDRQRSEQTSMGGVSTSSLVEKVTHLSPPERLKAIYMTSWVAGTPSRRAKLLALLDSTELNAIVIDIKDETGKITFATSDPALEALGSVERRIRDIAELIRELHRREVYVIGRVVVFEDAYLPSVRPDLALRRKSDGTLWHDRKGQLWLNPLKKEVWNYTVRIAKAAHAEGFDEINFDYIRFPSDGEVHDIDYEQAASSSLNKLTAIEHFSMYLGRELRENNIPISADLFGQITSAPDDMGIGQSVELMAPHFDYIAPMVYPSHYSAGFLNYPTPAEHPYEVVKYALEQGQKKIVAASSTILKIRPWLQDFSLATEYTPAMLRAQIKATEDAGLHSWMLWSPSNVYSSSALEPR